MEVARWLATRRRPPVQAAGCLKVNGLRGGQRARHHGIFQASAPAGSVGQEGSLRARQGWWSRSRCAAGCWSAPSVGTRRGLGRTSGRWTRSGGTWISGSGGSRSVAAVDGCGAGCTGRGPRASRSPVPGSEFTRDFECLVAWLATRTDKSTIKRMLRIDWDTVGRLRDRHRRGQLEAPTQVPHTRGRPSPPPGGVGMRRVRPSRRGRVLFRARPAARR